MASFNPSKKTAQDFNNNTKYINYDASTGENGDSVQADTVNNLIESALYTQQVTESAKEQARQSAEAAQIAATTAVDTANTANNTANSAKNTADTANQNASTALSTANSASATATNAEKTANEAKKTAETAETNSAAAATSASQASNSASAAKTAAETAATQSTQAAEAAKKAQEAAERAFIKFEVGDYFITANTTSPAARFGGTWEELPQGTFLMAAGRGGTAGQAGGSPYHSHEVTLRYHAYWNNVAGDDSDIVNLKDSTNPNAPYVRNTRVKEIGTYRVNNGLQGSSSELELGTYESTGRTTVTDNRPQNVTVHIWRKVS